MGADLGSRPDAIEPDRATVARPDPVLDRELDNLSTFPSINARDESRTVARSKERLLELLGPLDPARNMSYPDGVAEALAPYSDVQISHAVRRVAQAPARSSIGLLVDRANTADEAFFPPASVAAALVEPLAPVHNDDAAGRSTMPPGGPQWVEVEDEDGRTIAVPADHPADSGGRSGGVVEDSDVECTPFLREAV